MEKKGTVRPSCSLLCKGALQTPESVAFTKTAGEKNTWLSGCHGYLCGSGHRHRVSPTGPGQLLVSSMQPHSKSTPHPHSPANETPCSLQLSAATISLSISASSYIAFSLTTSIAKWPKCHQAGQSPIPELPPDALLPRLLQPGLGMAANCHRDPSWFSSIPELQGVRQWLTSRVPYPELWGRGAVVPGSARVPCHLRRCSTQTESKPCDTLVLAGCFHILSSTCLPPVLSWLFPARLLYFWRALGFTDL